MAAKEKMQRMRSLSKTALLFLALFLALGFGGRADAEEEPYTIFYEDTSGTSLVEEEYAPQADNFDDLMAELIEQFTQAPEEGSYISALPESVKIQGYERGIDELQIDFSDSYYKMDNVQEVLTRAAVVKTFGQIPGVTKIMISVDAQQLLDADGKPVAAMDPDSFIDTKKGGISSYQFATLDLYFPAADGEKLQKEVRNVDYSSNMVLERVIVEQLIAGSSDPSCLTAVNPAAEILDVSTKNGICSINFSEEFNEVPTEGTPSAKTALYCIIDSICDTAEDIDGVKFSVEGQSNVLFWGEVDLNNVFLMDESIVEPEAETFSSGEGKQTETAASGDSTLAGAEQ